MPGAQPLLRELRKFPNLDARAVVAVAQHEGLGGGVGDQGTSFGPFQLHQGGALPAGIPLGQAQAWAWSPAGIDYALEKISQVAGGMRGGQAITNISRRFERPANPEAEIADALRHYGGQAAGPAVTQPGPQPRLAQQRLGGPNVLADLIGQTNEQFGLGSSPTLAYLLAGALTGPQQQHGLAATPPPHTGSTGPGTGLPPRGGIAELLQEGTGGPTHSTGPHIHAAFTDPQLELAAIQRARQLGLSILENPYVGDAPAPGIHAKNSYHYRDFPGVYNGRRLGEAIDVSGPRSGAFYQWLNGRRR